MSLMEKSLLEFLKKIIRVNQAQTRSVSPQFSISSRKSTDKYVAFKKMLNTVGLENYYFRQARKTQFN